MLTDRQRDYLWAILLHMKEKGIPPTMREMCRRVGVRMNQSAAYQMYAALQQKGFIERDRDRATARGLRVVGFLRWDLGMPVFDGTPEGLRLQAEVSKAWNANRSKA